MAKWNKGKVDSAQINGGNEFTTNDVLTVAELNALVNNSLYGVEVAELNTFGIGTVTSGEVASATISGVAPNKKLNLVLPKGEKGDKGDKGDTGSVSDIQALVGYDISKGTIEERLDKLGFKEGSVILSSNLTATRNELKRQGNYVLLHLTFSLVDKTKLSGSDNYFELPIGFEKKHDETDTNAMNDRVIYFSRKGIDVTSPLCGYFANQPTYGTPQKYKMSIDNYSSYEDFKNITINFGYEAKPLQ
jgi:hypothetical protein